MRGRLLAPGKCDVGCCVTAGRAGEDGVEAGPGQSRRRKKRALAPTKPLKRVRVETCASEECLKRQRADNGGGSPEDKETVERGVG